MGPVKKAEGAVNGEADRRSSTICLHAYSDLSCVSPLVFLYLLKESYVCGKSKATKKFRALHQQVYLALNYGPQPGPAVFVAHCLYLLPLFEPHTEGFSHLIISALRRFSKHYKDPADLLQAADLAAELFLNVVYGPAFYDERILVKIIEAFDVKLVNVETAVLKLKSKNIKVENAEVLMEKYILQHIESQSFMTAVSLLEQFSIRDSGESLMFKILQNKDYRAAEKWAIFMGKSMLCILVDEYAKMDMLKDAHGIIKRNNLQEEFPEVYHKCKESALKKLAEKGCWDVAEVKAKNNRQLLEYLVYLAMEAGYPEKVDELCQRYSLEGFVKSKEPDVHPVQKSYLHLQAAKPDAHPVESDFLDIHELFIDDLIWVDDADGLQKATSYMKGCKVLGIDCEWKPNYVKGSKPSKVSIIQIASEKIAFVVDLIKLYDDAPEILDSCLTCILHSPSILKLGYNFQCDSHQLSQSYPKLECFKRYEMLLDVQKVFNEPCGGLSGLAKKILGAGLDKMRRNSNWEQRPLTQQQLEYAALDAVVLIHLFQHIGVHSQPGDPQDCNEKMEWKSHIVSHVDSTKKSKKKYTSKEEKSESDAEQV